MKCIVISDKQDDALAPLYAAIEAQRGLTRIKANHITSQDGGYNTLLEDVFLIVDVRQGFDIQKLSALHAEYPGAPIVCLYDQDDVDTRTLVTFGGADAALKVDQDFSKVINKGIELTDIGKEKYREPTGVIIYAGEFRINTQSGTYRRLSREHTKVVDAMAEAPFSGSYYSRKLTRLQCSVLEALVQHRNAKGFPRNGNNEISLKDLADLVYKPYKFPKRNGLHLVARALTDLFGDNALPSMDPEARSMSAGVAYDPKAQVLALLDSIYTPSPPPN